MKLNERAWSGDIISWINEEVRECRTRFHGARNDAGITLATGRTKFPDILLFTDKVAGVIFNGWELKYPDTSVDDAEMLKNAIEKAERLKSDSIVTWNGTEAIIWKINDGNYAIDGISILKRYPKEPSITRRDDLADPIKFNQNEPFLRKRLVEILHDLAQLFECGELKEAINVSSEFVDAVKDASFAIVPQFQAEIKRLLGIAPAFRSEFNQWKIYESSTLKILESSSRRSEKVYPEQVLAKFAYYNLIGKIIFYLTLSENLAGQLSTLHLDDSDDVKNTLNRFFNAAKEIDYQAVFQPSFTDRLEFSRTTELVVYKLFQSMTAIDFKVLPTEVIGTILENLIPADEKQKFGQYFTPETLANLVSFPAIQTVNDNLFDPTSGTGTFLNAFYKILGFYGKHDHGEILNQIWGNDVSQFPALLSVINLYKQNVGCTDNFPRIVRDDFFNLEVGKTIHFPDSHDPAKRVKQAIPTFDVIASNFPFIQQEDIPNEVLTSFFRERFENDQRAFLRDNTFSINERSDYFTYCVYNSLRFLKQNGYLSAITSNAWLGKEYGFQLKRFLLDNFHVKYVVRSDAEHWFKFSQVSTIFMVLRRSKQAAPTKFITLSFKLNEKFNQKDVFEQIGQIGDFYADIDNVEDPRNLGWNRDEYFQNLYKKNDGSVSVSIISRDELKESIEQKENWDLMFTSPTLFKPFEESLDILYPNVFNVFRGERTGWDPMFVIPAERVAEYQIETRFLVPYVKSPENLDTLEFAHDFSSFLFVCDMPIDELRANYRGAFNWIKRFEHAPNRNDTKTVSEANSNHSPFWYSLRPKTANIVTAINPYERFFFSFSEVPFTTGQRLISFVPTPSQDIELIAALLNSFVTFLSIEMRGTARNLGVLDLNADYFKTMKILNPNSLSEESKTLIKRAFGPLKRRAISEIFNEVTNKDRQEFDRVVLRSFGIDDAMLPRFYQLLVYQLLEK